MSVVNIDFLYCTRCRQSSAVHRIKFATRILTSSSLLCLLVLVLCFIRKLHFSLFSHIDHLFTHFPNRMCRKRSETVESWCVLLCRNIHMSGLISRNSISIWIINKNVCLVWRNIRVFCISFNLNYVRNNRISPFRIRLWGVLLYYTESCDLCIYLS